MDAIILEYTNGATLEEIATKHGMCQTSIWRILRKAGVKTRSRGRRINSVTQTTLKIRECISNGLPDVEISKMFKLSHQRINQIRFADKHRARVAVRRAVESGKLIQSPCEVCGEMESFAHHDDYSLQLNVRWLCKPHHQIAHFPNAAEF